MTGTSRLLAAGAIALGLAAWEVRRRRDVRAVERDPVYDELTSRLTGRPRDVGGFGGVRLHVEEFGDPKAPAIVLIHGWCCSIDFWHYQIRDLSERYRVIAYDQRGHGRSSVPDDPSSYSAEALAGDLDCVLSACIARDERALVVGHSMGGVTIVAWAGRHADQVTDRLAGAVLVNTGMSEMVAQLLVLGPRAGARLHLALVGPLQRAGVHVPKQMTPLSYRVVRRLTVDARASPGVVGFIHRMVLDCPAPVRAGFGRLFRTLDLSGSVPALTVPAIVIAGEHDRLLPPWHSQQLVAALPDVVDDVELRGVGHMSPLEAPDDVTRRIASLAARTLGASASSSQLDIPASAAVAR